MNKIEVNVLNPGAVDNAIKMMVCAARLTQRGHNVKNMDQFMELYEKPFTDKTVSTMCTLPHPTIQKFGVINVVVTGASRRFLAQITRHQNEVKFMSASLQYSDYSGNADFVVPYEIIASGNKPALDGYLETCKNSMQFYEDFVSAGGGNDSAGYAAPQSLRNILIISATPYQWKHMISQRTCRRNTDETRYVMLLIWKQLYELAPEFFGADSTGPFCLKGKCREGKMGCANPILCNTPHRILLEDFGAIYHET